MSWYSRIVHQKISLPIGHARCGQLSERGAPCVGPIQTFLLGGCTAGVVCFLLVHSGYERYVSTWYLNISKHITSTLSNTQSVNYIAIPMPSQTVALGMTQHKNNLEKKGNLRFNAMSIKREAGCGRILSEDAERSLMALMKSRTFYQGRRARHSNVESVFHIYRVCTCLWSGECSFTSHLLSLLLFAGGERESDNEAKDVLASRACCPFFLQRLSVASSRLCPLGQ